MVATMKEARDRERGELCGHNLQDRDAHRETRQSFLGLMMATAPGPVVAARKKKEEGCLIAGSGLKGKDVDRYQESRKMEVELR